MIDSKILFQGKKQPHRLKAFVMNSNSYLYKIEEAALMMGVKRNVFFNDYLKYGFSFISLLGKPRIRKDELESYQEFCLYRGKRKGKIKPRPEME